MAILAMAIAALGELARQGMRNAAFARDTTQAQLLCESKMAEILAGIELPEPVIGAQIAPQDLVDPYDPVPWLYSIETAEVEEPGVIAVAVTVTQDLPPQKRPATFTLVRWITDPGIELSDPRAAQQESSSSGTSTGGSSGASSGSSSGSSSGGSSSGGSSGKSSGGSSSKSSGGSSGGSQNTQGGSRG